MRTGVNISFSEECLPIIKRMASGELSRVCRAAILEWGGGIVDYETAKRRHATVQEEMSKLSGQLTFLSACMQRLEQESTEKNILEQKKQQEAAVEEAKYTAKEERKKILCVEAKEFLNNNLQEWRSGLKAGSWATPLQFYLAKHPEVQNA